MQSACVISGSRDTGRVKSTEVGVWDSRELKSVKSIAGLVSDLLSKDDRLQLADV